MADPETYIIRDGNGDTQTFTPNADPARGSKQDTQTWAINLIGTRKYGTVDPLEVTGASNLTAAITATEVMLHAKVAMYVLAVAGTGTPTVTAETGIPLEVGEKFHMRITSGQRIAAIADDADGVLYVVPVTA